MVKIKQKKQLNLPQLIEWAWDNDMRDMDFESEGGAIVYFDYDSNLTCARGFVPQDFFTVTTEEEITEDTVIDELVELYEDYLESNEILKHENRSISEAKDEDECASQAFYIIHDDLTMTLIWTREKGLVE